MKNIYLSFLLCLVFVLLSVLNCKTKQPYENNKYVKLRSNYQQIDDFKKIKDTILKYNFYDKRKNKTGNFKGRFKEQKIENNVVILDFRTKLMWMTQEKNALSWTKENLDWFTPVLYKDAESKIANLNKKSGYAGYRDWRMPTIEEAASLLRKQKNSKSLFLPDVFSIKQKNKPLKNTIILYIWTGDYYNRNVLNKKKMIWTISFSAGGIFKESNSNPQYIRLVRTFKTKTKTKT
jgi:hypothetical protein